jgi:hypothetical protein
VFAALHYTAGDVGIAAASLAAGLALFGSPRWPDSRFATVLIAVVIFGVGYTAYSEHLNTAIRRAWAYSALMPVLPGLEIGLAPLHSGSSFRLFRWFGRVDRRSTESVPGPRRNRKVGFGLPLASHHRDGARRGPDPFAHPCDCVWPEVLDIIRSISGPPDRRKRQTSTAESARNMMFSTVV